MAPTTTCFSGNLSFYYLKILVNDHNDPKSRTHLQSYEKKIVSSQRKAIQIEKKKSFLSKYIPTFY